MKLKNFSYKIWRNKCIYFRKALCSQKINTLREGVKKKLKKIILKVRFLPFKIAFFWFLKMINILGLNHTWLQKVKYLLNESSDLYET